MSRAPSSTVRSGVFLLDLGVRDLPAVVPVVRLYTTTPSGRLWPTPPPDIPVVSDPSPDAPAVVSPVLGRHTTVLPFSGCGTYCRSYTDCRSWPG